MFSVIDNWDKSDEELYGTPTNKINIFEFEVRSIMYMEGLKIISDRMHDFLIDEVCVQW